jgi:hypothetical protein
MTEQKKPIKYDLSGYESITSALLALINDYPALSDGDEIEWHYTCNMGKDLDIDFKK